MNTKNCSTVNFLCSSFLGGLHVLSAMQFGRDDAAFSYICRSPRLKTKIPSNCQTKRVLYHWKNMYIFVGFRRWHQTKNESRVLFKRYHRKNMYIFAEQHQSSFYKWCSFLLNMPCSSIVQVSEMKKIKRVSCFFCRRDHCRIFMQPLYWLLLGKISARSSMQRMLFFNFDFSSYIYICYLEYKRLDMSGYDGYLPIGAHKNWQGWWPLRSTKAKRRIHESPEIGVAGKPMVMGCARRIGTKRCEVKSGHPKKIVMPLSMHFFISENLGSPSSILVRGVYRSLFSSSPDCKRTSQDFTC